MKLLLLTIPMALLAAPISELERVKGAEQLQMSRQKLVAATEGLTAAQWTYRAAEGRWTIAEVVEHLAVTEGAIPQLIQRQLLQTPAIEKSLSDGDDSIRRRLVDRSGKAQAPEILKPSGKFPDGPSALRGFLSQRAKLLEFVRTNSDDLRGHAMPHMALGTLDGYQWILFVSGHAERHTLQIEEVKASPGYPKGN